MSDLAAITAAISIKQKDPTQSDLGSTRSTHEFGALTHESDGLTAGVTVMPRGEKQLLVRSRAQFNIQAVSDPGTYQDFFTSLGKAMFLEAHQVD